MPSKNRDFSNRPLKRTCTVCKKYIPTNEIKRVSVDWDGTEHWYHDECGKTAA